METITLLISSVGGATTVLLCVGFFGKKILKFWFEKQLEHFKAEVSHKNAQALEVLKSEQYLVIKNRERSDEVQVVMDRYRGPLLHAANDLQSRIYNLVEHSAIDIYFINQSGDGSEKQYFIKNTAFLIAQYFAWTEIIRREIQFIEFNDVESTRRLAVLQAKLCSVWQGGSRNYLSIWAGEQRGIGELMIEKIDGKYQCIGYSSFLNILGENNKGLLHELETRVRKQLESKEKRSHRLISVQNVLIDIIGFLDPESKRFEPKSLQKIA
ncbi:hypothetical protein [Vibrio campbellii]|uniref:hypothetical protein n=1 Tax=Vibrio campbellii TaxID=680 RepID=UPI0005ED9651|nr:hypothetical protein [Vibrio campbellii]